MESTKKRKETGIFLFWRQGKTCGVKKRQKTIVEVRKLPYDGEIGSSGAPPNILGSTNCRGCPLHGRRSRAGSGGPSRRSRIPVCELGRIRPPRSDVAEAEAAALEFDPPEPWWATGARVREASPGKKRGGEGGFF